MEDKNLYHDKYCVFVLVIDKEFIKDFKDKKKAIKLYEKLLSDKPKSKITLFKIQECVFKQYKINFDYKTLVNNSIIG